MSEQSLFLKASSHYLVSQVAILAASLVSFPIIVRILSVEEYGVLSLCNTMLLFGVAFSKLGLQNSIVRFYPEFKANNKLPCFFRTFAATGLAAGCVFFLVTGLSTALYLPKGFAHLGWLVAGIVLLQTLFSYLTNFFRSQEKTKTYSMANILVRYLSVFGGIGLVLWLANGIVGLLQAQIAFYGLVVVFLAIIFKGYLIGEGPILSRELIRESLKFGVPLAVFEVSSIILAFSDRFLISHFNGPEALGVYAVGYTLCMYIADLVRQPLSMAMGPMYVRIYTEQGEMEAQRFLGNLGGILALVALPVFAGCMAIREELVIWLASEKYAQAAQIFPWVLGALLIYSSQPLLAAGLYLKKKTSVVAKVSLSCGVLNILANMILLPRFGFVAAAWTTAGCYVLSVAIMAFLSAKAMKIAWPWMTLGRYAFSASVLFSTVAVLPTNSPIPLKIVIGLLVYPLTVLLVDSRLRGQLGARFLGR